MIRKVKVPKISANITDATLTAWYKNEGDTVLKGEALLELTTEKTAFELESPCKGVLRRQVASRKSVLPAGYVLALVGSASDTLPDVDTANSKLLAKHRATGTATTPKAKKGRIAPGKTRVRATPAARRIAKEPSIDLADAQAATGAKVVTEDILIAFFETVKGTDS